jgi:hypothetical protein
MVSLRLLIDKYVSDARKFLKVSKSKKPAWARYLIHVEILSLRDRQPTTNLSYVIVMVHAQLTRKSEHKTFIKSLLHWAPSGSFNIDGVIRGFSGI